MKVYLARLWEGDAWDTIAVCSTREKAELALANYKFINAYDDDSKAVEEWEVD